MCVEEGTPCLVLVLACLCSVSPRFLSAQNCPSLSSLCAFTAVGWTDECVSKYSLLSVKMKKEKRMTRKKMKMTPVIYLSIAGRIHVTRNY